MSFNIKNLQHNMKLIFKMFSYIISNLPNNSTHIKEKTTVTFPIAK